MPLLTGHDEAVANWVAGRLGITIAPPYVTLGVLDGAGTLVGGAVFTAWDGANIDVTIYGPGAMTRPALRAGFRYVFGQLRCERLTARTKRTNVAMRRLMQRLGFRHEGTQRHYWGPTRADDALLYGMTREECRWLDERTQGSRPRRDGQRAVPDEPGDGDNAVPARRHQSGHALRQPQL